MSDVLTNDAPETNAANAPVGEPSPVDGTAAASGSAGATTRTVDADRFNGLMASHQKALSELRESQDRMAALEARLNQQEETPIVTEDNSAVLAKLEAMEQRAQAAERQAALNAALVQHPEAAPFADLIQAGTPDEIESVVAAIAERARSLTPEAAGEPTGEPAAPAATEAAPAAAAPEAPVVAGGATAPAEASSPARVAAALEQGDWSGYWAAKLGAPADTNLA